MHTLKLGATVKTKFVEQNNESLVRYLLLAILDTFHLLLLPTCYFNSEILHFENQDLERKMKYYGDKNIGMRRKSFRYFHSSCF